MESAFHTTMRKYRVNGEEHVANAIDFAIPDALAPVVSGTLTLHNFRRKLLHHYLTGTLSLLSAGGSRFRGAVALNATIASPGDPEPAR